MELHKRVDIVIAAVFITAVILQYLEGPSWPLDLIMDIGVSFILSGVFYMLLRSAGLDFLEDIQFGFLSAMTLTIFVLKHLLI